MKPPVSILDKRFSYTPSALTDLDKKFKAIRKAQRKATPAPQPEQSPVVRMLKRGGR